MEIGKPEIEKLFRSEHGRVFASLVRVLSDFHLAEDALQEAYVTALRRWPVDGVPARPGAWLTTVARNAATDAVRRATTATEKAPELLAMDPALQAPVLPEGEDFPDDRLRLVFTCCHPALGEGVRVALTLQAVCGLTAEEIARLLLQPKATVAQQLVRAKRKILLAGIPYEIPPPERWEERLEPVLSVVYLLFTEGYLATRGEALMRHPLTEEAIHLGRVLTHLMPREPEVRGLLALMLLHDARRAARLSPTGELVPLERQDRTRWDARAIHEGVGLLDAALMQGRPGPYQIQAAIAALHGTATTAEATDWPQIAALYAELMRRAPSPVVALNHAVAVGMAEGPEAGLAQLGALERAGVLADSHRLPAARAELLRRDGRHEEARQAWLEAQRRVRNECEARYIERALAELEPLV